MANDTRWRRRDLIRLAAQTAGILSLGQPENVLGKEQTSSDAKQPCTGSNPYQSRRPLHGPTYEGEHLSHIAFPMGGIGAGMICLEGTGSLTKFSLRHVPDLVNEPAVFAALGINGREEAARVLEGPVPKRKLFPEFPQHLSKVRAQWGLPRFGCASFEARFPFGEVTLRDNDIPVSVRIVGWSPFEPGNEDDASLPVAGLEYEFTHRGTAPISAVFSFNADNFLTSESAHGRIRSIAGGFVLDGAVTDKPWTSGSFAVSTDDPDVAVNHAWFRNDSLNPLRTVWRDIAKGAFYDRAPVTDEKNPATGASLFVPFSLEPGQSKTIAIRLAWYVGRSSLRLPGGKIQSDRSEDSYRPKSVEDCYRPWYAKRFSAVEQVMNYWADHYSDLRERAELFNRTFQNSTLPPEVLEAVSANLAILKSPTVLRQSDGRFWGWEGCADTFGSCEGSSTHVWNYAQALPHLFPRMERSLRETEFGPNQDADGHQDARAAIPIRPTPHNFLAAADGQLGGLMKAYRDWRISGDTEWIRGLWPKIRASLDYCIRTWDPRHVGWLEEPHHITYDVEFWGPNGMCTSIYLGALKAATLVGAVLRENTDEYANLLEKGIRRMESELFNGAFFIQKVQLRGLDAKYPEDVEKGYRQTPHSAEELALAAREGPENQYGSGCLSDGVFGAWLAWACGIGDILDRAKVISHLQAVYRHNFKQDLSSIANPTFWSVRATYALGSDAGLILCSWPHGDMPTIPFPYATEVWTGTEYEVAGFLISLGFLEQGLDLVKACRRRYDGSVRNPFSEVEAGHWYARALSSYSLLQAFSGARYDAVDKILHMKPAIKGDFRCFLSTATGYGTVGVRNGEPFVEVVSGDIPYARIEYTAA